MTSGFALLNYDKSLQIYFFCVKRQAKIDFLIDVESTVGRIQYTIYLTFYNVHFPTTARA